MDKKVYLTPVAKLIIKNANETIKFQGLKTTAAAEETHHLTETLIFTLKDVIKKEVMTVLINV